MSKAESILGKTGAQAFKHCDRSVREKKKERYVEYLYRNLVSDAQIPNFANGYQVILAI